MKSAIKQATLDGAMRWTLNPSKSPLKFAFISVIRGSSSERIRLSGFVALLANRISPLKFAESRIILLDVRELIAVIKFAA